MNCLIPKSQLDAILNPGNTRRIAPLSHIYSASNMEREKDMALQLVPTTFKVSPEITNLLLMIAEKENLASSQWIETVVKFYAASKGYID